MPNVSVFSGSGVCSVHGLTWPIMPGLLTERLCRVILFMAGVELGFLWVKGLTGAGPRFVTGLALWSVPILLVSLALCTLGANLVLSGLHRFGVFGRVGLADTRLLLGRRTTIDLSQPFQIDARKFEARIERRLYLPSARDPNSEVRTQPQRVFMAVIHLVQGDVQVALICDRVGKGGRAFSMDGTDVLDLPIAPIQASALRVDPADWVDILKKIDEASGENGQRVALGDRDRARKLASRNPLLLFCPLWKTVSLSFVIVLIALLPWAYWIQTAKSPGPEDWEMLDKTDQGLYLVIQGLHSTLPEERLRAAEWLRENAGNRVKPALPELLETLKDKDPAVRAAVEEAIRKIESAIQE